MKKIISIVSFIIVILFIGVFIGYLIDNDGHLNDDDAQIFGITPENRSDITLYSNRPININQLTNEIMNEEYFEGYNVDTLLWMQSLKQKEVFVSNDSYIIMNKIDASKIKTTYITDIATTDTYDEYYIDCHIVEKRSLGGKSASDIIVVEDVKYLGNKTFYYEV